MEEPQQPTDSTRRDSDAGWIVFGPICFTGLGVTIAVRSADH
jgi:hypothetical protein